MTANVGLEYSFLESWEGWDQVGCTGDVCFYECKVKPLPYLVIPEGTKHIITTLLMSESTVQFDFYGETEDEDLRDSFLGSQAFKIKAVLEEEIPCE